MYVTWCSIPSKIYLVESVEAALSEEEGRNLCGHVGEAELGYVLYVREEGIEEVPLLVGHEVHYSRGVDGGQPVLDVLESCD